MRKIEKITNIERFIERSLEVHGDKYSYEKTDLSQKNDRGEVCITCKKHGDFWMMPSVHVNGCGCKLCALEKRNRKRKLTQDGFIKECETIHHHKYDYSLVEYKNIHDKIKIICPEHGVFKQEANSHIRGNGCPKCTNNKRLTLQEFVEKSVDIHGNKYDYSNVVYKNNHTPVKIICPEHGEFWQTPTSHMIGGGCPKCASAKRGMKRRLPLDDFIEKAKSVHGDKYDYSKVKYVNSHTRVCIICPKHGDFWQIPTDHIHGKSGCPKCDESKLEKKIRLYLDENNIKYVYEAKNSTLPWIRKQSIDFYLPEYNVGIECQGGQHYIPIDFYGGKDGFYNSIERDKRKKVLCEENNLPIFYFTDKEFIKYQPEAYYKVEDLFNDIQTNVKNELK